MDAIKNIKIEISKKEDYFKGEVEILCTDKEILHHDLDDAAVWIITHTLQKCIAAAQGKRK